MDVVEDSEVPVVKPKKKKANYMTPAHQRARARDAQYRVHLKASLYVLKPEEERAYNLVMRQVERSDFALPGAWMRHLVVNDLGPLLEIADRENISLSDLIAELVENRNG